jgi:GntR family transcriptional regulator
MPERIDDTSGIPRYVQVARIVERGIRAGVWKPGSPVPSGLQLSQQYGIAKTTAAKSHAYLAERHLVVRAPGVGMVVLPRARWAPAEAGED